MRSILGKDFTLKRRDGTRIDDWQDWEPPKEDYQWKAGRSAMELARAWFTSPAPIVPKEFQALLSSHSLTKGIRLEEGYPEHVTPLPERGTGRNHDLVLKGRTGDIPVTVCVEAKVDELFGNDTVEEYWIAAEKKRSGPGKPKRTRAPERIDALLRLAFGVDAVPDRPPWGTLRYQLLAALTGTILQAIQDGSFFAIFVVHEFHTLEINPERVEKNASDYEQIVRALTGVQTLDVEVGKIYGPIRIHPKPYAKRDVELFVGKCIDRWRYPERG
jgi:hypothetical protein